MHQNEDEFVSLNRETGMLEDPDEIRRAALTALITIKKLLSNPLMALVIPIGVRLDVASLLVMVESFLRPTSQAAYLRQLALLSYGYIDARFDEQIREMGYSETLPTTHPDAPHPIPPPMDPNSPEVKGSLVLQDILRREQSRTAQPQEPKVDLPKDLEEFLKSLNEGPPKERE